MPENHSHQEVLLQFIEIAVNFPPSIEFPISLWWMILRFKSSGKTKKLEIQLLLIDRHHGY